MDRVFRLIKIKKSYTRVNYDDECDVDCYDDKDDEDDADGNNDDDGGP